MNFHPILFSPEMIRANLEGRKTQTRRVVTGIPDGKTRLVQMRDVFCFAAVRRSVRVAGQDIPVVEECANLRCPYGVPGDVLWARETHWRRGILHRWIGCDPIEPYWRACDPPEHEPFQLDRYVKFDKPEAPDWAKCPSIHMPRWACRLWCRVESVRVERVQDISEADAVAEGIRHFTKDGNVMKYWPIDPSEQEVHGLKMTWQDMPRTAKEAYAALWDSINEKRGFGWKARPWVWAITYTVLKEAPEGWAEYRST